MIKHYELFLKDGYWEVRRRASADSESLIVATFIDEEDARMYVRIKKGTNISVRRNELDRIKENVNRIYSKISI